MNGAWEECGDLTELIVRSLPDGSKIINAHLEENEEYEYQVTAFRRKKINPMPEIKIGDMLIGERSEIFVVKIGESTIDGWIRFFGTTVSVYRHDCIRIINIKTISREGAEIWKINR